MANIYRHGFTPQWGTYSNDDFGSGTNGVILDSYNYSVEIKDYEQLDETGKVAGYLVYDQTVNFDMSGTILYSNTNNSGSALAPAWECNASIVNHFTINCNRGVGALFNGVAIHEAFKGYNNDINTPNSAIVKSFSVNTSQGSAATFSLSGTIYGFPVSVGC